MAENLPYSNSIGTLENMLQKIKTASVPERFTQDFVSTKLSMKGGAAKGVIPFLKKMGFVASDGTPTDLYREFRNPQKSRLAIGKSFRQLYNRLYEMNEYVHDADDDEVMGLIVECTGGEKKSVVSKYTIGTFNLLRKLADFDDTQSEEEPLEETPEPAAHVTQNYSVKLPEIPNSYSSQHENQKSLNLSYTINLNLPATKDVEVFNAIFKSLKEHLLEK